MIKDKPMRVDPDFLEKLEEIKMARVRNKIDDEIRVNRELTKMMMNCPSFPNIVDELSHIPKKEDIDKILRRNKLI